MFFCFVLNVNSVGLIEPWTTLCLLPRYGITITVYKLLDVRVQNKWRCNYIYNHLSSYCSMAVSLFCGALLFVGLWSVFAGLWAGLVDLQPWPIQRPLLTNPLDAWIAKESSYALQALLANIGAEGAKVKGAVAGIVVASPSKEDPDCMQNPSPISRH